MLRRAEEAMATASKRELRSTPEIHVCQSSTCRPRGSEAVVAEIEELAKTSAGTVWEIGVWDTVVADAMS